MKYKHAFWISLPFAAIGLGKIIHKHKCSYNHGMLKEKKHEHLLKLLSWRLGLSAEQQNKLHTIIKQTQENLGHLSSKRKQLHTFLEDNFTAENLNTDTMKALFNTEDLELTGSTVISAVEQFHSTLTPLQREKVSNHLKRHSRCHSMC